MHVHNIDHLIGLNPVRSGLNSVRSGSHQLDFSSFIFETEIVNFYIGRIEFVAWNCSIDCNIFVFLEGVLSISQRVLITEIDFGSVDSDSCIASFCDPAHTFCRIGASVVVTVIIVIIVVIVIIIFIFPAVLFEFNLIPERRVNKSVSSFEL